MLGPARSDSCEGVTSVDLAEPSCNFGEDLALGGSFWLLREVQRLWEQCCAPHQTKQNFTLSRSLRDPTYLKTQLLLLPLHKHRVPTKPRTRERNLSFPKPLFCHPVESPAEQPRQERSRSRFQKCSPLPAGYCLCRRTHVPQCLFQTPRKDDPAQKHGMTFHRPLLTSVWTVRAVIKDTNRTLLKKNIFSF